MFATELQNLRRTHHLSQTQLSEILSVSRQMISKYETGQAEPDFAKLVLLADYFETTVDALLGHATPLIQPTSRRDHKILIQSRVTTELTTCYKFWISPIVGNQRGPQAMLLGVDDYSNLWGNHNVQLGWYATKAAAQRELAAIERALVMRQYQYELAFTYQTPPKRPQHRLGQRLWQFLKR